MRVAGEGKWVASYDRATGSLEEFAVDDLPEALAVGPSLGWYRFLDGEVLVVLSADDHGLWLRLGEITTQVMSLSAVDWVRQPNGMARLALLNGERVVAAAVYFGGDRWGIPPEADWTPFRSTKDDDFGEFVHDVIRRAGLPGGLFEFYVPAAEFDSDGRRAAIAALPAPVRGGDLGPLAGVRADGYRTAPLPSDLDDELRTFLLAQDGAPEPPTDFETTISAAWPVKDPPVMALAMRLLDPEREVLHVFAARMADLAVQRGDAELLPVAVIAAVLGGLDCDSDSATFQGAREAIERIGGAAAALHADLEEVTELASLRVGVCGRTRLEAWRDSWSRRHA